MADYSKLQDTAQRLISSFGSDCVISRSSLDSYDPETNAQTGIVTSYTIKGVKLTHKSSNFDKEIVKASDSLFFIEAKDLPITPTTDDKVIIDSVSWSIIAIHPVQPASTVIYYEMILRK